MIGGHHSSLYIVARRVLGYERLIKKMPGPLEYRKTDPNKKGRGAGWYYLRGKGVYSRYSTKRDANYKQSKPKGSKRDARPGTSTKYKKRSIKRVGTQPRRSPPGGRYAHTHDYRWHKGTARSARTKRGKDLSSAWASSATKAAKKAGNGGPSGARAAKNGITKGINGNGKKKGSC